MRKSCPILRTLLAGATCLLVASASFALHAEEATGAVSSAVEPKVTRDVAYSQVDDVHQSTSLDVYAPVDAQDLPVMVWIHGGAWKIGDKRRVEEKPAMFNKHGFVLVSINYRLVPSVDVVEQGKDVARAVRWVYDHIAEYGGSPEKIFLMGHSAGAHLAALVATDEKYLAAEKLTLKNLQGVVLLDGAGYDIPRQIKWSGFPRLKAMYREVFSDDEAKQLAMSPITYVEKGKNIPPFLILFVSTRLDGRQQSQAFGRKLTEAGVPTQVVAAENKTHGTINRELGMEGDLPTKAVLEFLDQRLGNSDDPKGSD